MLACEFFVGLSKFSQGQLLVDIPEIIISCLNGNKRAVNVSIIGMTCVVEKRKLKYSWGQKGLAS